MKSVFAKVAHLDNLGERHSNRRTMRQPIMPARSSIGLRTLNLRERSSIVARKGDPSLGRRASARGICSRGPRAPHCV